MLITFGDIYPFTFTIVDKKFLFCYTIFHSVSFICLDFGITYSLGCLTILTRCKLIRRVKG